jgi:hypothetical protein
VTPHPDPLLKEREKKSPASLFLKTKLSIWWISPLLEERGQGVRSCPQINFFQYNLLLKE